MQDCDLLVLSPRNALVMAEWQPLAEELYDEPELRYEVESMQHWIDLNA